MSDLKSEPNQQTDEVEAIFSQIQQRMGCCPALFRSVAESPSVLRSLWQQAEAAYLDNPLPALFKAKLFAYLSRYCEASYCVARHSAWLINPDAPLRRGQPGYMTAEEVVALLRQPRATRLTLLSYLDALDAEPPLAGRWPAADTPLESRLFACAVAIFLRDDLAERCQRTLRRLLGQARYQALVLLLAFIRTAHYWTTTQEPLEFDHDIVDLLQRESAFADWLASYEQDSSQDSPLRTPLDIALRREKKRFEDVIRAIPDAVVLADLERIITYCNPGVKAVFGYDPAELIGRSKMILYENPEDYEQQLNRSMRNGQRQQQIRSVEIMMRHKSGRIFPGEFVGTLLKSDEGQPLGCLGLVRDVTVRKQAEAELHRYNRVLEALAEGASLPELLALVVRLAEDARRGMLGSILLLDETKQHLRCGDTGRLPAAYCKAIEGLAIGPRVGACGAAAYTGQTMIVEDIATHPNWEGYRELTLDAGLAACWSEPIRSADNEILGTFAVYFHEPQSPTAADRNLLRHSAQLVELVLERARNNELLRDSEQRYRSVVEASSAIVSIADARGEFRSRQPSWYRYTGQDWPQHRGWGWAEMIHPDDASRAARAWRNVLRKPAFSILQFRLWHAASGEYRHVQGRAVPIFKDDGSVHQWVGTTDDIHDRVLAEEKLRQREHEFRTLADNVPELFSYTDAQLRFRFVNRRYEEVHCRPRAELIGTHVRDLLGAKNYRRGVQQHFEAALRGKRVAFETNLPAASNPRRWASVVLIPDLDDAGQVRGVFAMETDITERRMLEKQLLDAASEEARRIGNDLHDGIGQELTGLSMVADTLVTALSRKAMPEVDIAEKIRGGAKRALKQVRSLAQGLNPVNVDAQGLMSALSQMSRRVKDIYEVECEFRCERPVLLRDNQAATQLYRIAQEATTNAVKHGRATRIVIELEHQQQQASLRIVDNGIGMATDADRAEGMGLRIMKYRAGIIGGNLQICEAADGGTAVCCSLSAEALSP
ncbi:PAS domain S-box protein [Roseimaritima ulvae]|uniref:histidine kinase n=1 Tax=Roseimaritima ulvae TaxID=980254 RepID=A0A5B9QLF3_9BACT|nr:PAS domain S-box protein [Roseimaritima ulvae]QEG38355.1 Sensor histidine kinase LiaS [Roseimaritima ulvae]